MRKGGSIMPALLYAIILFGIIYLPLHMVYFYGGGYENVVVMLVSSAVWGLAVSVIYGLLFKRKKVRNARRDFVLYASVHAFVFITSYLLFSYGPYEGWMQTLYYYYPQMIIVLFGSISAAVFWLVLLLTKAIKSKMEE